MGTIRGKKLFDTFRRFGVRAPTVCAWISALGILFWVLAGPKAAGQLNAKNVLVLYTVAPRTNDNLILLESTVRAHVPERVDFYTASLENRRDEEESYRASLAETLRSAYAGMKIDLVIANSRPALDFAVQYRDKMFPATPIVFTAIAASELEGQMIWPNVTGLTVPVGMRETIDLALHLDPDANAVAVIGGGPSALGKYWLAVAHSELLRHQDKVMEIDITGPASAEMLEKVAALPSHTIVLFQLGQAEANQLAVSAYDVLDAVAQRLPTYSAWSGLCLNHGCIGGAYEYAQKGIVETGELAARVLMGEPPENIPVVHNSDVQVQVDWRALQRWHIPESALPVGSLILYRPPSLWEQHRQVLIVVIVLIAALALLIVGLLWQRARRRKAEAVMREAEERFRVMADSTPSLVWMCDRHGKITYLNERRLAFTGPDPKAGYGDSWIAYVHPDDVKDILDILWQALKDHKPFSKAYRLRRSDGVYRWMFDVAAPRVNGDGSFAGFIGSAMDVTEQKLAQQALEKISGQLIEAQEKERSRIARDLHDDICQRLALLSMEIEQANRSSNAPAMAAKERLEEIRKHCSEIAGDVQSLSHQLHSSKLDYLGIVAAIRGFCSEFSKQHEVSIAFTDRNVPGNLHKDVSLCLFRVAQEALHNALKYSGVSEFSVEISGMTEEIRLLVRDAGVGFDVEEVRTNRGLGLVSMQERVHLVHGIFSLESQPGRGTAVLVVVPFAVENRSAPEGYLSREIAGVTGML